MKLIEIVVNAAGETSLQTRGFVGQDCQATSKKLEQALGWVAQEHFTAEYHQSANQNAQQQAQMQFNDLVNLRVEK